MSKPPEQAPTALHFSDGKAGVDQVPPEVIVEWGQVFTYGETKYGRDNWRKGTTWHEFYASALRHLLAFWTGEDDDPESGLPHLAHAIWNLGAIRYYQRYGLGLDDRPNRTGEQPLLDDEAPLPSVPPRCDHVMLFGPDVPSLHCELPHGHEGEHSGTSLQRPMRW